MRTEDATDPAVLETNHEETGINLRSPNNTSTSPQQLEPPRPTKVNGIKNLIKLITTMVKSFMKLMLFVVFPVLIALSNERFISTVVTRACKTAFVSERVPYCADLLNPPVLVPPDFHQLASLQTKLEHVMDDSTTSSLAAIDIRNSEISVRDLTTHVKHSSMVAKDSVVDRLNKFVSNAKTTSRDLQGFSGRVGEAVDQIVSLNEAVLLLLEDTIKDGQSQLPSGPLQNILNMVSTTQPSRTELVVRRQKELDTAWRQASGLLESTIQQLIHDAKGRIVSLERLEGELNAIYDMVVMEDKNIIVQAEELSNDIWTILGSTKNKERLRVFESDRQLLEDIRIYRKRALLHVSSTLDQLKQIHEDLRRQRKHVFSAAVASPDRDSTLPLESHLVSMQKRTEQLIEGQHRVREREAAYRRRGPL